VQQKKHEGEGRAGFDALERGWDAYEGNQRLGDVAIWGEVRHHE